MSLIYPWSLFLHYISNKVLCQNSHPICLYRIEKIAEYKKGEQRLFSLEHGWNITFPISYALYLGQKG
ncbi:hypothetical protein DF216_09770 [Streptococcus oralis]|uniref:Uncharacterized protein n=1 Tax=Streptococcus oralis TaxID=1303 RepID=A0A4Q2FFR0_STROR|nr:hypothetical protein DF216_09770 [Streptococcus oralis]